MYGIAFKRIECVILDFYRNRVAYDRAANGHNSSLLTGIPFE
jgi:hypothetical protein